MKKKRPLSFRPIVLPQPTRGKRAKPVLAVLPRRTKPKFVLNETDTRWLLYEQYLTYSHQLRNVDLVSIGVHRAQGRKFFCWLIASELSLTDMTPGKAQQFVDYLSGLGYKNKTIHDTCTCVSAFYKWAMDYEKFAPMVNPINRIRYHRQEKKPQELITAQQYAVLRRHFANRSPWDYLVLMGWETGARLMDVKNLKWDNVNFEADVLSFSPSKTDIYGIRVVIPLNNELRGMLRLMQQRYPGSDYICPHIACETGRDMLGGQFINLVAQAGITTGVGYKGFRHGFVTRMLERGIPPQIVMTMSGHRKLETILKYMHVGLDVKRAAMAQANGGPISWPKNDSIDQYLKG